MRLLQGILSTPHFPFSQSTVPCMDFNLTWYTTSSPLPRTLSLICFVHKNVQNVLFTGLLNNTRYLSPGNLHVLFHSSTDEHVMSDVADPDHPLSLQSSISIRPSSSNTGSMKTEVLRAPFISYGLNPVAHLYSFRLC